MTLLTDVSRTITQTTDQARQHRTGGNRTALTVERGPFSQVPHWVWTLDLEHAAIRVYGILMMHADYGTRQGFPGIRRIAEEGRMATSTVQRSLEALERVGAIVVTRTQREGTEEHAANRYHLPWEPRPTVPTIGTEQDGGVPTIDTPGVPTIDTELETSSYLEARAAESSEKADPFTVWAEKRCEQRGGGPGLLKKILAEDYDIWQREHAAADLPNPSPARNHPGTCPHLAIDTEGWCAACMTQPLTVVRRTTRTAKGKAHLREVSA